MWKVAALAALLVVSVCATPDKTRCNRFCTTTGKETTCDVPKPCGLETTAPNCIAAGRKVTGSQTLTAAGKLCSCGATGECTEVAKPDCPNVAAFKEHTQCNGLANGEYLYVDQYCLPSETATGASPTLDDTGAIVATACTRNQVAGKCYFGFCLSPTEEETIRAPIDGGDDVGNVDITIATPAQPTVQLVAGIPVIVLQRPSVGNPFIDVTVNGVTGWKFGAAGPTNLPAGAPGAHMNPAPGATGYRITIDLGTSTDNQLILSYAIPFVRIGTVDLLYVDEMILIVVLPKINAPTIRGTGAVWKSGATIASAATPLADGSTKIAIGNFITLEGAACDPYGWINAGFVLKKGTGVDEVEEFWDLENFAEIQTFQFVRTEAEPTTKVTIAPACFGLLTDAFVKHATVSQTWTVDARPGKINVAASSFSRADLFLFGYQVRNPPATPLYTLPEIATVTSKIGDTYQLKNNGAYRDPTEFFTVFDQLKQRKITKLADDVINGVANLDTELECSDTELNFLDDLQALVELGDRNPDGTVNPNLGLGDVIEDAQGQFLEACFESDAADEANSTASASQKTQSVKFISQASKKTKSAAAKARSAAQTPAQKLDTNKKLRRDALLAMRTNLEQELSELTLTPGTVFQLTSKDPKTKAETQCWKACAVRQPAIKPKEKINSVCTIGTGTAKDEVKIRGDEKKIKENTAANRLKYPEDAIVGLLKYTGTAATPQCNYEKTNKNLKSEGSYHVFVLDFKKLPVKGKPTAAKPKSAGLRKLISAFRARSQKFAAMSAAKHASEEKFGVKQATSWDFVVTPAQYDTTTVSCQIRTKDGTLQTAFLGTTTAADGNGCVMGNDQNIGVDTSLILVPKSAANPPSKPATVAFKSAAKTTISAVVLLVLAIVAMML